MKSSAFSEYAGDEEVARLEICWDLIFGAEMSLRLNITAPTSKTAHPKIT